MDTGLSYSKLISSFSAVDPIRCFESNLNGEYHTDPNDNDYYQGLIWELWLGDYSLRATQMKIKPSTSPTGRREEPANPLPPLPTLDPFPPAIPGDPELPLRQA